MSINDLMVTTVVVVVGWMTVASLMQDRPPEPDDREWVAAQLDLASGVVMVLPTTLPAGYSFGRSYGYNWIDDPTDMGEEPTRADSREVTYIPADGVQPDGPPAVIQCVELVTTKPSLCVKPNASVQRRFGPTRVTFYAASNYSQDLTAWKTVKLTTDLDKVTWLR
jgi:hypothetical protein